MLVVRAVDTGFLIAHVMQDTAAVIRLSQLGLDGNLEPVGEFPLTANARAFALDGHGRL